MTREEVVEGGIAISTVRFVDSIMGYLEGGGGDFRWALSFVKGDARFSDESQHSDILAFVESSASGDVSTVSFGAMLADIPDDLRKVVISFLGKQRKESHVRLAGLGGEERVVMAAQLYRELDEVEQQLKALEGIRQNYSRYNSVVFALVDEKGEPADQSLPLEVGSEEQWAMVEPVRANLIATQTEILRQVQTL